MRIELTEDLELVASVLQHPDLFDRITDDAGAAMSKEELLASLDDGSFYFKVTDNNDIVKGIFGCYETEDGSLELHISMLPEGRRAFGAWAFKRLITFLFENTTYTKLVGRVPAIKGNVLAFISAIGFKLEYMIEKEFIKNGVEYDMYYLSMLKQGA